MADIDEKAAITGDAGPPAELPLHDFGPEKGEGEDGRLRRDDVKQPPVKATWVQMATVMVADVVGVGVLSLAGAVSKVGWVLGMLMLFGFFPLNMYTGVLLSRTRALVPKSVTMSDMAWYTLGKWAMVLVAAYVYANVFFILGAYLLVTGESLGMTFFDTHLCLPVWMAIAAAVIFLIMQFSRTLHYASYLCWWNMLSITVSVFIAIIYLFIQGKEEALNGSYTEVINPHLTVNLFFQAMGSFVFAYSGQFMYLELMAEMKTPEDFPKTFAIAGPYQLFMYAMVSCVGYSYKGIAVKGFIISNIPFGPAYRASSIFLFLHMIVTYIIKGQVLSRAIHIALFPSTGNDTGIKGRAVWALITFCLLALGWVCATAIPFFDYFTSLLGSLQALPTLILPAVFFIVARRAAGVPISMLEYAVQAVFCFALGVLLIIFGLWGNINDINASYSKLGGPFQCHCESLWSSGCASS